MRWTLLAISLLLAADGASNASRKPSTAVHKTVIPLIQKDFRPAGPFLFGCGAVHPIYMDWLDTRPLIKSPDGKYEISVTGQKESLGAWVTIKSLTPPDRPIQVWPIQRNVDILWRSDSKTFAITDDRYANLSYVLLIRIYSTKCERGTCLRFRIADLTPIVRKAFETRLQKYYSLHRYEILLFYAKVLRWIQNDQLLVGVSAMVTSPPTLPNRGAKEWNLAYIVNVTHKVVLREINRAQLISKYGIKVAR